MCLTIPGRIVAIDDRDPVARTATVDYGGPIRTVSLLYTPEAEIGTYVIVHAGFATRSIPEDEALEAIAYARAMAEGAPASPAAADAT